MLSMLKLARIFFLFITYQNHLYIFIRCKKKQGRLKKIGFKEKTREFELKKKKRKWKKQIKNREKEKEKRHIDKPCKTK